MAKAQRSPVEVYLDGQPDEVRALLEKVRVTIQRAVPEAEEAISYRILAFKLLGSPLLYFAGWRDHYAIYPATAGVRETFGKELAKYDASGKGTIRFPLDQPVPVKLIAGIAKLRAKEVRDRRQAASARKKLASKVSAAKDAPKGTVAAARYARPSSAKRAKRAKRPSR